MRPFELSTARLVLNRPGAGDVEDIADYCTDPLFERFMVTPWPYERKHAEWFVAHAVPQGWADGTEWNWAIRAKGNDRILGMIGVRFPDGMIGYWLGLPHRRNRFMSEAVRGVVEAVFDRSDLRQLRWECRLGNTSSLRTAQRTGFTYAGISSGAIPGRDGKPVMSWTGTLERDDSREPKPGWPEQ